MKIKQRKYMSEKEALHWLVDNFKTDGGLEREGVFYKVEFIDEDHKLCWTKDGRFYITEEVEITEDEKLSKVIHINRFNEIYDHSDVSIKWLIQFHDDTGSGFSDLKYVYLQNEDGSIGDLIWSKERGLVD